MDNAQRSTLRTSITHALLCLTLLLVTPQISSALDRRLGGTGGVNTGEVVVELASVMGGLEWAIDMPWRMEPPYDRLPITVVFHDVADPKDGSNLPGYQRFCGLVVAIAYPPATPGLPPTPIWGTRILGSWFHEVERSAKWPADSDGPAFHTVRRAWRGEAITPEDLRVADTAEWHGTALVDVSYLAPGDYMVTAAAIVSPLPASCLHWQHHLLDPVHVLGLQGRYDDPETHYIWHANTFRVHLAQQPLPRFGPGWVYGDLHYHSQGTDNEGESGYSYRAVLQAMKAMGLDFVVAADHASDSDQVTDIDEIFVDNLPDLPYVPGFIEDMILDRVNDKSAPYETSIDAARDMNPRRWRYLHGWLNGPAGANRQVLSSGGQLRMPQIFLGGEVDAIPEISEADRANGYFTYGNGKRYNWAAACYEIPSLFMDLIDYTTFDVCPTSYVLTEAASEGGRYKLRDIQGMASPAFYARQHLIHLPSDPTRTDAFVASETSRYGGAHRRLKDILTEDYDELGKGYFFLTHPVAAASGSNFSRLGPDIVPYSDVQLTTAFRSPHFLGLQLWNEDTRLQTKLFPAATADGCGNDGNFSIRAEGFPMGSLQDCDGDFLDPQFGFPNIRARFSHWGRKDEAGQLSALHHGAAMWDKLLLWGLNPAKTAGLSWLAPGAPRRVFMAGGSDAHGDLNYRREGSITGWSSATDTAIGKPRNLMFVGTERPQAVDGGTTIGQTQVVEGFKSGQFSVTDGPALRIAIDDENGPVVKPTGGVALLMAPSTIVLGTVNALDAGDVPMGGVAQLPRSSIPLLVEWKSTPEFGPVTSVDIYIGSQAGTLDGGVWAPSGHGTRAPYDDPSGTLTTELPAGNGTVYKQLFDGYLLDPNGKLRITVSPSEGMGGMRKIVLNCADYPVIGKTCQTVTETIPPICTQSPTGHGVQCTKPQIIERTVCQATSVTTAERLYVRAFARTSTTAPVAQWSTTPGSIGAPFGTGVPLERYAYTNPIWVRPTLLPKINFGDYYSTFGDYSAVMH